MAPQRTREQYKCNRSVANRGSVREHMYHHRDGSISHIKGKRADGTWTQWRVIGGRKVHGRGALAEALYNRPAVDRAIAQALGIWVAEGEKDAEALAKFGLIATTNDGGALAWNDACSAALEGAVAVDVILDNDKAGLARAERVQDALQGRVGVLRFWLPAEGNDAHDHLVTHGLPVEAFKPYFRPASISVAVTAPVPRPEAPSSSAEQWALDRLDEGARRIREAAKGIRNNTLNGAALFNFRLSGAGLLDEEFVEQQLTSAAIEVGLKPREIRATLNSARDGARKQGPLHPRRRTHTSIGGVRADSFIAAVNAECWKGKGERYRRRILLAMAALAERTADEDGDFIASRTMIAAEADSPSMDCIKNALAKAQEDGWLLKVEEHSVRDGTAAVWRLQIPSTCIRSDGFTGGSYSDALPVNHPAFLPSCWGFAARDVLAVLSATPGLTTTQVAHATGIARSHVDDTLRRLAADRVVLRSRRDRTWRTVDNIKAFADRAAAERGATTEQVELRARLHAKRRAFHSFRRSWVLPTRSILGEVPVIFELVEYRPKQRRAQNRRQDRRIRNRVARKSARAA